MFMRIASALAISKASCRKLYTYTSVAIFLEYVLKYLINMYTKVSLEICKNVCE